MNTDKRHVEIIGTNNIKSLPWKILDWTLCTMSFIHISNHIIAVLGK